VNNFFKKSILLLAAACLFAGGAYAQLGTPNPPRQDTAVFGFFNGAQGTAIDAQRSLVYLQRLYDDSDNPLEFELFYHAADRMESIVEAFIRELNEQLAEVQNRYELFFDSLRGGSGGWWDALRSIPSLADGITGFLDSFVAEVATTVEFISDPESDSDVLEHRQRINAHALEGRRFLFVADSQDNAFVDLAYRTATAVVGVDAVRTVTVDPASVRLANERVRTALTELEDAAPPIALARSGLFTATLEWDGLGDVDLHTYEPGGTHVYYAARQGRAGYLDVDNVDGFGPEHYFASFDPNQLETGIYRIAVANYARATGRRASVQIASAADGVLGTRQKVLGEPTQAQPSVTLFRVEVRLDSSGQYRVRLVD